MRHQSLCLSSPCPVREQGQAGRPSIPRLTVVCTLHVAQTADLPPRPPHGPRMEALEVGGHAQLGGLGRVLGVRLGSHASWCLCSHARRLQEWEPAGERRGCLGSLQGSTREQGPGQGGLSRTVVPVSPGLRCEDQGQGRHQLPPHLLSPDARLPLLGPVLCPLAWGL